MVAKKPTLKQLQDRVTTLETRNERLKAEVGIWRGLIVELREAVVLTNPVIWNSKQTTRIRDLMANSDKLAAEVSIKLGLVERDVIFDHKGNLRR